MNILLLTPYYAVSDKKDFFEDTRAIHYFTKEWINKNKVRVINTYFNPFSFFLKKPNIWFRIFSKRVYKSKIDGVEVFLYEFFKLKKGLPYFSKRQMNIVYGMVSDSLNDLAFNPEVVIFHFPTLYWSLLLNKQINSKKMIVIHQSDITALENDEILLEKFKKIQYDGIAFRSTSVKRKYESIMESKINNSIVLNSGISRQMILSKAKGYYKKKIRILYVGKLIPRKNIDLVLKALSHLRLEYDFIFEIVGDGKEKTYLQKLTKDLSLEQNVEFTESIPRNIVLEKMRLSDIFIMPSVNETFGLVYIEAMASSCITIGTKNEGIDGTIKDGENGFLVEVATVSEITKKLKKVLELDSKEVNIIQENALKKSLENTEYVAANKYLDYLRSIL